MLWPSKTPSRFKRCDLSGDNVDDGIAIKDVLANAGLSRPNMEHRFHRWLKCSIRAEIIRRRLERVCALLQQTDLGLEEISRRTGFSTTAHFCRLFQHRLGQTPTQYRRLRRRRP